MVDNDDDNDDNDNDDGRQNMGILRRDVPVGVPLDLVARVTEV